VKDGFVVEYENCKEIIRTLGNQCILELVNSIPTLDINQKWLEKK
jgi:hypothetical protein